MFKRLLLSLALAATLPVQATVLTWTLHDVTFADGGTASGSFSFETTTLTALGWDITTTAGSSPGTPFTVGYEYVTANSRSGANGQPGGVVLLSPVAGPPAHTLALAVDGSLVLASAHVPVDVLGFGQEIAVVGSAAVSRKFTGGYVSSVPEPAPAACLALGLLMLGVVRWRHGA